MGNGTCTFVCTVNQFFKVFTPYENYNTGVLRN